MVCHGGGEPAITQQGVAETVAHNLAMHRAAQDALQLCGQVWQQAVRDEPPQHRSRIARSVAQQAPQLSPFSPREEFGPHPRRIVADGDVAHAGMEQPVAAVLRGGFETTIMGAGEHHCGEGRPAGQEQGARAIVERHLAVVDKTGLYARMTGQERRYKRAFVGIERWRSDRVGIVHWVKRVCPQARRLGQVARHFVSYNGRVEPARKLQAWLVGALGGGLHSLTQQGICPIYISFV